MKKENLNYIITNLTDKDRTLFLEELGQYYVDLLMGKIDIIPENFWNEWLDVAEFESDKESLKEIRESILEYEKFDANPTDKEVLTWEEICRITDLNR